MPKLMHSKKFKVITLSLFLVALLSISFNSIFAQSMSGNNIVLESGQTLEKTSFLSGNNIRVDGNINGTTFAAAGNVEINGDIDGDLFVAAQSVTVNGAVKGSIFTASQNVTVNGHVKNNIYSAGATLNVNSKTDGSTFLAGQNIYIEEEATIDRDAFIGGANVYQNGMINGDLASSSETLSVKGTILGDLNYRSTDKVNLSNDAQIEGETNWKEIEPKPSKPITNMLTIFGILFSILAALIVWLVMRLMRRTFWTNFAEKILQTPLKTFGFGTLVLILIPFVVVFLMITIIGIPLGLILLAFYVISLYISKIILSVFIAFWFQKKYNWSNALVFWPFLLSLILLSILVVIPFIGWILRFVIVAFGLGSIILSIKKEPYVGIEPQESD